MMAYLPLLQIFMALLLAPLLPGIINRTKAFFAGRRGQPLLQAYFDLWRLLNKGAVYSRSTTWLFRLGPIVILASVLMALLFMPWGGLQSPFSFAGDLLLFAYLLGLARVFTVLAALETGSAFEGMGASREVFFSALCEPALLIGLAALARVTGFYSLSSMYGAITPALWLHHAPVILLLIVALFIVYLSENARIPVDDPNTHLELTMIHEVMVLDHSGPDFAFILYGSALKLWTLGGLIIGLLLPSGLSPLVSLVMFIVGIILLSVLVGIIESIMARLRLVRVPQMLVSAGALSVLAAFLA